MKYHTLENRIKRKISIHLGAFIMSKNKGKKILIERETNMYEYPKCICIVLYYKKELGSL